MPGHTQNTHGYIHLGLDPAADGDTVATNVRDDLNAVPPANGQMVPTISHVADASGDHWLIVFVECPSMNRLVELANLNALGNRIKGISQASFNQGPIVFCCISDM